MQQEHNKSEVQAKTCQSAATPRTCTRCDDLEARAGTIVEKVELAIFRKACVTRGDLIRVQTYKKYFDTCKEDSARLR